MPKITPAVAAPPGGAAYAKTAAPAVPARAPPRRRSPLYAASPRPRAPLHTMNAVKTTQPQCSRKNANPIANAAASATPICRAMRVLTLGPVRLTGRRSRREALTSAASDVTPMRAATKRAIAVHPSATSAAPMTSARSTSGPPAAFGRIGTTSMTTNGSAIKLPTLAACSPNCRNQIDRKIAATNSPAPTTGFERKSPPTNAAATATVASIPNVSHGDGREPGARRASVNASTADTIAALAPADARAPMTYIVRKLAITAAIPTTASGKRPCLATIAGTGGLACGVVDSLVDLRDGLRHEVERVLAMSALVGLGHLELRLRVL